MPVIGLEKGKISFSNNSGIDFDHAKSWESLAYNSANIAVKVGFDETQMEMIPVYVAAKLATGTTYAWTSSNMDDSIEIYNSSREKVAESEMDEETYMNQKLTYTCSSTGIYYFKFNSNGYGESTVTLTGTVAPSINPDAPLDFGKEKGLDKIGRVNRFNNPTDINASIDLEKGLVLFHPMTGQINTFGDDNAFAYNFDGTPTWQEIQGIPCCDMSSQGYTQISMYAPLMPTLNSERTYSAFVKIGNFTDDSYNKVFEFISNSGFAGIKRETQKWVIHLGSNEYSSESTASTNTWYHVALIKKDTKWMLYVNGNKVVEQEYSYSISSSNMSLNLYIGYIRSTILSPVKVYNRALSNAEIIALKNEYPFLS